MARTTFCWFPPERDFTETDGLATLIPSACICAFTVSASCFFCKNPFFAKLPKAAIVMFFSTLMGRTRPSPFRSSVTYAIPCPIASFGLLKRTSLPSKIMRPDSGLVMPKIECISSVRPAPTSPTNPRISPLWSLKLISSYWLLSVRCSTSSTGSPIGTLTFGNCTPRSRPTILRISMFSSTSSALKVLIYVPSRKTVISSQIWKISSILWEI